jgi:hypothetical protein
MPGQILKTNNINRLSLFSRENVILNTESSNKVELKTDWDISLNIETVDLSEIQKHDCIEYQQLYDQCIKSHFLQQGNNSIFSELFLRDVSQWSQSLQMVPTEVIHGYFATIMSPNAIGQCSNSCSYIQVQFDQKATRKHLKINFIHKTKIKVCNNKWPMLLKFICF